MSVRNNILLKLGEHHSFQEAQRIAMDMAEAVQQDRPYSALSPNERATVNGAQAGINYIEGVETKVEILALRGPSAAAEYSMRAKMRKGCGRKPVRTARAPARSQAQLLHSLRVVPTCSTLFMVPILMSLRRRRQCLRFILMGHLRCRQYLRPILPG